MAVRRHMTIEVFKHPLRGTPALPDVHPGSGLGSSTPTRRNGPTSARWRQVVGVLGRKTLTESADRAEKAGLPEPIRGIRVPRFRRDPRMDVLKTTVFVIGAMVLAPPLQGGSACERLDLSSKTERIEPYYELRSRLESRRSEIPERWRDHLDQLESQDALTRAEAAVLAGLGRLHFRLKPEEPLIVAALTQALRTETQPQVAAALLRPLGELKGAGGDEGLETLLLDWLGCDEDQDLLHIVLGVAQIQAFPSTVQPLIELWDGPLTESNRQLLLSALTEIADPASAAVGLDGFRHRLEWATRLLTVVGTRAQVPELIEIYEAQKADAIPPWRASGLDLIGHLGGPPAVAYLRQKFEEADPLERMRLGNLILRAQLEPEKPTTDEARRDDPCLPWEEIRAQRLPFVKREAKRLLAEENRPYFREASWYRVEDVYGVFRERDQTLEPKERVELWRRVLDMLGPRADPHDGVPGIDPRPELIQALASRASELAFADSAKALAFVGEALDLTNDVRRLNSGTGPLLLRIAGRIEKIVKEDLTPNRTPEAREPLVGTYHRGTGFEGHKLQLNADGTYQFDGQSDAMGGCTNGHWVMRGTYHLEGGRVALSPGPSNRRHNIDAPDLYTAVPWGPDVYLLHEAQFKDFCTYLNRSGGKYLGGAFYHRLTSKERPPPLPPGRPQLPAEWVDFLLVEPVDATILSVEDGGLIQIDAGHQDGLREGMRVYATPAGSDVRGVWELFAVGPSTCHGRSLQRGVTPEVGMEVSTLMEKDDG